MKILRLFLLALIVIGLGLLATQSFWVPRFVGMIIMRETVPVIPLGVRSDTNGGYFNISQSTYFRDATSTLQKLVRAKGSYSYNTFCIIGHREADAEVAWVYWQEGKAIILWEPGEDVGPADSQSRLVLSRRYLVLGKDIVASTTPALNTSSYLESYEWARTLISTCEKRGSTFVLGS